MKKSATTYRRLTENQIDTMVVAEADAESAWTPPVTVKQRRPATIRLPAELAGRAAFLARIHHRRSAAEWVESIIRERVDFEESALSGLKQAVATGRHD
ncbi:MAG: hypothetical protein A3K19_04235 [Lentisphaerae bacterium RIFOXYB12_FULL_65_16]|nr:MAG: hypothetical protein A3K18_09465 [Lentisphaerae bacterium RIFOXYA12_64_32]OGV84292.1 MAG: hypothetical protein A3K19_04235 [Lentisphaerae bacterium RIFOXYB12_FULL_65_16]